jgi:hypothetical protein
MQAHTRFMQARNNATRHTVRPGDARAAWLRGSLQGALYETTNYDIGHPY